MYIIDAQYTSLENGAHKFELCAIGAQPLNHKIIPDGAFDKVLVCYILFETLIRVVTWQIIKKMNETVDEMNCAFLCVESVAADR